MRRWLAFTLGLAMIAVGFWALATAQPIGWVHPEIDAASKARLESVLRDTGEARTLVP